MAIIRVWEQMQKAQRRKPRCWGWGRKINLHGNPDVLRHGYLVDLF